MKMDRRERAAASGARLAVALACTLPALAEAQVFSAGDLIVSGSTYADVGQVSTISAGSLLAPSSAGGANTLATANGQFANVFLNAGADASFGVTSQVFLQDYSLGSGSALAQYDLNANVAVTSFSSKSELAINISSDGSALTFMAYDPTVSYSSTGTGGVAAVTTGGSNNLGLLDISNSNTPGLIDSTNPVNAQAYRTVVQLNLNSLTASSTGTAGVYNLTGGVTSTNTNAYSGNNGRAVILYNGQYYMVGNAGNGSKSGPVTSLAQDTGVQTITPGSTNPNSTVVGACTGTNSGGAGYQCGYNGSSSDKTGKDDNFRGLYMSSSGSMYVSKGSGGNGVDTVYQVSGYNSPSTASVTIAPGFATSTASSLGYTGAPFGIWQANSTTMYVAFEGDGNEASTTTGVSTGTGGSMGGLGKYSLVNGTWTLEYFIQGGLGSFNDGVVASGDGVFYDDGLRNITGKVNANGTVTIYGVTSTVTDTSVSKNWDQGANPDQIVALTDTLSSTTATASDTFSVVETSALGSLYRGVALAPVPEPSTYALMALGLGAVVGFGRARRSN